MANQDGSTGDRATGITREDWHALGFEVALDGTLYLQEIPLADEVGGDASPILEIEEVSRPIVEDWCLCCEINDCSTCTDPECECCSSPQEGPARRR